MNDGSDDADSRDRLPLRTDLTPIVEAVAAADADAFVTVGDRFDDDLRYLTRFSGPDRAYALVIVPADDAGGRAVCCAPSLFREQAEREFVASARSRSADDGGFHDGVAREVRTERVGNHAGERAAAVIRDLLGGEDSEPTLLVPPSIPHDAAVYLERAGNALASTNAVARARARKTDAEIDRLRRVQCAAVAGMARAETMLAESEVVEVESVEDTDTERRPALRWEGAPLTTERLRRAVNATLADRGVRDAGDTRDRRRPVGGRPPLRRRRPDPAGRDGADRHLAARARRVPRRPDPDVRRRRRRRLGASGVPRGRVGPRGRARRDRAGRPD